MRSRSPPSPRNRGAVARDVEEACGAAHPGLAPGWPEPPEGPGRDLGSGPAARPSLAIAARSFVHPHRDASGRAAFLESVVDDLDFETRVPRQGRTPGPSTSPSHRAFTGPTGSWIAEPAERGREAGLLGGEGSRRRTRRLGASWRLSTPSGLASPGPGYHGPAVSKPSSRASSSSARSGSSSAKPRAGSKRSRASSFRRPRARRIVASRTKRVGSEIDHRGQPRAALARSATGYWSSTSIRKAMRPPAGIRTNTGRHLLRRDRGRDAGGMRSFTPPFRVGCDPSTIDSAGRRSSS